MSDPPLFDIDFKNKMAWVWTTFKKNGEMTIVLDPFEHLKREGSLQDYEG